LTPWTAQHLANNVAAVRRSRGRTARHSSRFEWHSIHGASRITGRDAAASRTTRQYIYPAIQNAECAIACMLDCSSLPGLRFLVAAALVLLVNLPPADHPISTSSNRYEGTLGAALGLLTAGVTAHLDACVSQASLGRCLLSTMSRTRSLWRSSAVRYRQHVPSDT
jgi:hypothetical protein